MMGYIKRQDRLVRILESESLDAILIRKKQNISYLTGTRGEDALLFISNRKNFLITDFRYKEEYSKVIKNCTLRIAKNSDLHIFLEDIFKKTRSRRIGFESGSFSYSEYANLKKRINRRRLIPARELVESLRMIKDRDEIRCIKTACRDGCSIMDYAVEAVRPFTSEARIKNRIEGHISRKGLRRADFEIIVASGKNASMPHAPTSNRNVRPGEMVIIDLGAMNYGYNSDLTRTVFLGRIDRKYRQIYNIVLDAQKMAIEKIRPGVQAKDIDNISRKYISDKGLGRYFLHSLGHGIGLETHEKPRIARNAATALEKGMAITIEPGIYIPGWGGVRIEDVVLITDKGCEVLTKSCRKVLCG